MRIILTERYFEPYTETEMDDSDRMGIPLPKRKAQYRRIYPPLKTIFSPKEIPGTDDYCWLEFNDGIKIMVMGCFEDLCQMIDDREAQEEGDLNVEGEEPED